MQPSDGLFKFGHVLQPSASRLNAGSNVALSVAELSSQIGSIVEKYKIKECLGLGVGNGAYLLLKYSATTKKNPFFGMIMISPSCKKAGWWEWMSGSFTAARMHRWGWTKGVRDHFARRLFSPATTQYLGGNSDLMKAFNREIQELNVHAVEKYLKACLTREDICPLLKQVNCRVLLVFGAQGLYQGDSMEFASSIDKSKFALVEIEHAGTLVNEEKTAELLSPFQLFLTALQLEGYGLGKALEVGQ